MNYDSNPPVYYDDPLSFYDSGGSGPSQPRIPMKKVVLKLEEKSLDQKLDYTTDLAAALTTNVATYASPDPPPATLTAKVTAITAKRGEVTAAQTVLDTKTSELAGLEGELDDLLVLEAAYIQKTSGGDETKINLLPVEMKASPGPTIAPAQVMDLKLVAGKNAGEVKSSLKPTTGAQGYEYEYTTDPTKPDTWQHLDTSSGSRTTFTGLTSGSKIWVRARAVGGKKTGKGAWSDPAYITVP